MFEPVAKERDRFLEPSVTRPPADDLPGQQLRTTLAAIVGAAIDGALPADGGFARLGLRREIAAYVSNRRASGLRAEYMLLELERLIDAPTSRLEIDEQRRVTDDLIAWAIEAYDGGDGSCVRQ